jgi:folate-dependent phosphoribosylglycinamide formyltransferase PurN
VPRRNIDQIKEKIRLQEYDMSVHAMEEMAEDNLDILDVEHSIFNG